MPRNIPSNPKYVPIGKKEIHIRYTIKHSRIKSLIPNDFKKRDKVVRQLTSGTPYNIKPLLDTMGIPAKRWNKIMKGGEPTIGEVEMYAQHFHIPNISVLYKVLPTSQPT